MAALKLYEELPPLYYDAHGGVRIEGSRVLLEVFLTEYLLGRTPEQVAQSFPTVSLANAYGVVRYYLQHKQEVDAYMTRRELEADDLRERMIRAGVARVYP